MANRFLNFFKPETQTNIAMLYTKALDSIASGEKSKDFDVFNEGMSILMQLSIRKENPYSDVAFKTIKAIFKSYDLKNFCQDLLPKHLQQLNSPPISERQFEQGRVDQLALKQPAKSLRILRP